MYFGTLTFNPILSPSQSFYLVPEILQPSSPRTASSASLNNPLSNHVWLVFCYPASMASFWRPAVFWGDLRQPVVLSIEKIFTLGHPKIFFAFRAMIFFLFKGTKQTNRIYRTRLISKWNRLRPSLPILGSFHFLRGGGVGGWILLFLLASEGKGRIGGWV